MKKYEKPSLIEENLALAFIATSCNYAPASGDQDPSAPYYPGQEEGDPLPAPVPVHGGLVLFAADPCNFPPENMGIQLCYHGFDPTDQANVFGS